MIDTLTRSQQRHRIDPLFIANEEDEEQLAALATNGAPHLVLPGPRAPGDYARKINTGHRAARDLGYDWSFLGADDLCFCHGWADEAIRCGERTGAAVIGTNDLGNPSVRRGVASTHSLVRTTYTGTWDRPDDLLCERYQHNYVDVELVATAKARKQWAFARRSLVEHLHPNWRKAEEDATYRLGQIGYGLDARLYQRRRRLWERGAARKIRSR